MEALNDGIDYIKEMFGMETEQTSKLTDAVMQTEQPMNNTRIFEYILKEKANKQNVRNNNKGALNLKKLKSLNISNEIKRLLELQGNHAKRAIKLTKDNAETILIDLQERNSDWMFEMVYNDKIEKAYYFRLRNNPNYTTKELIDSKPDYPHSYYYFKPRN